MVDIQTILIAAIPSFVTLLLVYVGFRDLWFQHSKRFFLITNMDNYPEGCVRISIRNDSPYRTTVDKICLYYHGAERELIYHKESNSKETESGNKEIILNGKEDKTMYFTWIDLAEMWSEASSYIYENAHPVWNLVRKFRKEKKDGPKNFSFKILIRSSGQRFLTNKWIPTESFTLPYKEKKTDIKQIETRKDLIIQILRIILDRWTFEPRPLRDAYNFRMRRLDSMDPKGYIADIAIIVGMILALLIIVSPNLLVRSLISVALISLIIAVTLHRATTGIVRRLDKAFVFVEMWFTMLLFLAGESASGAITVVVLGVLIPLFSISIYYLMDYFGGRSRGLWCHRVKRY